MKFNTAQKYSFIFLSFCIFTLSTHPMLRAPKKGSESTAGKICQAFTTWLLGSQIHEGFTGETLILVPTDANASEHKPSTSMYKPINSLRRGDFVLAADNQGNICTSKVLRIDYRINKQIKGFSLYSPDLQVKTSIFAAPAQYFFCLNDQQHIGGRWLMAEDITRATICNKEGKAFILKWEKELRPETPIIYFITVDQNHNLFVTREGIPAHNASPLISLSAAIFGEDE